MGISLEQKCTVAERWSAYVELGAVYEGFELDTTEGMFKLTLTHQFLFISTGCEFTQRKREYE
ncbi:hypothetical protein RJ45_05800 [Photobacterium gaetbulicola]|uniref:Uncharacterized protein n=1 Tax=Photobacterium gaetbulicola TaxID=1295392 RepID=A0A0B9H0R6_9GAMM|nr:hypothetical protein RJ45_05800 [Photobacterium gaetbulicola]